MCKYVNTHINIKKRSLSLSFSLFTTTSYDEDKIKEEIRIGLKSQKDNS